MQFAHLCGVAYQGGSLCFSSDGSTLLSPVGQRVTAFHLLQHRSTTFPFTLPSNVEHVALSPSNQLLVVVDDAGRAVFVHYPSHTLLFEFSFQAPVTAIAFSPQSAYLAVAVGPVLHIYPTPSLTPSYRPLHLHRRMQLHSAAIRCLAWSADGMYIISGGEDGAAKVVTMGEVGEGWEVLTLAGHREGVVGAWWGGGTAVGEEGGGAVRVYTVSKEGALLQWRWKADADDSESVRQLRTNRRALAAASSSSSHVQRPPAALTAVRLFGVTGRFALSSKHFFSSNSRQSSVSCCQLHHTQHGVDLLLVAFSSGSFSLYDLPSFTLIHSLSVSNSSLSSLSISPSGAWLACGSRASGSLLVWEWQSESYVLKQQGHSATVSSLSYSPDSQYVVTGGDDGRVKLWHGLHGFCFKTFAHHTAPVTAVLFSSNGNVVFSASLDGTVHAYDLVRYRLFRTFTTPTPAQFSCLALDPLGELLMAGTADPFDVFVFAVQTGRLLDVLSGHEGPISGLAFSPQLSLLLSSSWDRSVRLWDPFEGKGCVERLQHDSDVLSLAVAPDGLTLATALLNGTLQLWDIRTATLTGSIEVGKDIAGGRARDDVRTVKSRGGGYVTSMCWSADGSCLLVGGNSRFVCIYDAQRRLLVKRFTLSSNERMDGVKDRLNSRYVNDPRAHMDEDDDDAQARGGVMPGARTGERSARRFSLRMRSRCVRFAPTGLQWAAATTEGLLTFALHDELTFDPTDIGQLSAPHTLHTPTCCCAAMMPLNSSLRNDRTWQCNTASRAVLPPLSPPEHSSSTATTSHTTQPHCTPCIHPPVRTLRSLRTSCCSPLCVGCGLLCGVVSCGRDPCEHRRCAACSALQRSSPARAATQRGGAHPPSAPRNPTRAHPLSRGRNTPQPRRQVTHTHPHTHAHTTAQHSTARTDGVVSGDAKHSIC